MTVKSKENSIAGLPEIGQPSDTGNQENSDFIFDLNMFDANSASVMLSAFNGGGNEDFMLEGHKPGYTTEGMASNEGEACLKIAAVKFMITKHEENALLNMGYTQEQIYKLKPQEAAEILKAE